MVWLDQWQFGKCYEDHFDRGVDGWTKTGLGFCSWGAGGGEIYIPGVSGGGVHAGIIKTVEQERLVKGKYLGIRIGGWAPGGGSGVMRVEVGGHTVINLSITDRRLSYTGLVNINGLDPRIWIEGYQVGESTFRGYFDALVVCLDKYIDFYSLNLGNVIKIVTKWGTFTGVETGEHRVRIDCNVGEMPFLGQIEVYDTDSVTLIYTHPIQYLYAGDAFGLTQGTTYILGPAANLRIYEAASASTPKSADITVTLKRADTDAPLSGKTIAFSTCLGSVYPATAVTDSNGQATTTLSNAPSRGWAVVKASFVGDGTYASSNTYVEAAVYADEAVGDSTKPYQVFVQGKAHPFSTGTYKKSVSLNPQAFSVELKEISSDINGAYEVMIYRRGILDFIGRIINIKLSLNNKMMVSGISNHWKLARRIVNMYFDAVSPETIVAALLARYPCGISAGTLDEFGAHVSIQFTYDTFLSAIQRLRDMTGYYFRLNLDDTLDFASDFGATRDVTFTKGTELVQLERELDYSKMDTRTVLIGDILAHVSDKENATQAALVGLIEEVFIDKNLRTVAMLDIENQKILDSRDDVIERNSGVVVDLAYDADAYDVFDSVTITDSVTGLSGTQRIVSIERNLTDKGTSRLEIANAPLDFQDYLALMARIVKDISTAS